MPPPSLLPRLHVLSYERLDLEELALHAMHKTKTAHEEQDMDATTAATATGGCPEPLLKFFDTQSNPKETQHLAQALWMCLMSKADRRSNGKDGDRLEMLRAGPMERALGCLSLQC